MNIKEYEEKYERVYCKQTSGMPALIAEGMVEFDEYSANWLAGPFKGNFAYFMLQYCNTIPWKLKSEKETLENFRFSHYNIPNYIHKGFKGPAGNEIQLQKRLSTLTEKEKKYWENSVNKKYIKCPTIENPIRFYICGNDDTSYSKFFPSQELALDELALLVSMQPIDYTLCLTENGFVFTN